MIIDCISDIHGYSPTLSGGDLLLICGDLTAGNRAEQYHQFLEWLDKQPYACKVVVAGNHDGLIEQGAIQITGNNIHYLCDSGFEFEGLKIWGSPYTPTFMDWYFMRNRGEDIRKHWDLIPQNIDILVTHGPPYGIFDQNDERRFCGCQDLLQAVQERVKPRLHCFGHIHEGAGGIGIHNGTTFVNCSYVDVAYRPVHRPVRITWFT
jgi:Icc-related predicted phosphoesterase